MILALLVHKFLSILPYLILAILHLFSKATWLHRACWGRHEAVAGAAYLLLVLESLASI